jgi:hypothetical protein
MKKARLAELARVVLAVSDEDPVAAGIIDRMADEVVAFAGAVVRRLDLGRSDPDVALGASILKAAAPTVEEKIRAGVRELAPKAHVLVSPSEPIVGAALVALDALGVDASAKARARNELDAGVATLRADPSPSARRPSSLPQPAPG